MVYQEKFVVAIKCDGKILREDGEYVTLPFGSEYSILLKNLNSRNAVISIEIDGQDVLYNDKLIVNSNSDIELDGFKKGNKVTNRFKFIQKTDEISEHRGDRVDDGYIRVEVTYEEPQAHTTWTWDYPIYYYQYPYYRPYPYPYEVTWCNTGDNTKIGEVSSGTVYLNNVQCTFTNNCDSIKCSNNAEDSGITVKGNDDSKQKFVDGYIGNLESNSSVIIVRLRGTCRKQKVKKPLFVSSKLKCENCGQIMDSGAKFCRRCGTCLR